jgi:hypothetical protein
MSRPALSLVPSVKVNAPPRQMSLPVNQSSPLPSPADVRAVLSANWGRFCLARFADAEACAEFFGVTRQCAWNWMESDRHRPSGHHVAYAILRFGPDLAAFLAGAAAPVLRVAA